MATPRSSLPAAAAAAVLTAVPTPMADGDCLGSYQSMRKLQQDNNNADQGLPPSPPPHILITIEEPRQLALAEGGVAITPTRKRAAAGGVGRRADGGGEDRAGAAAPPALMVPLTSAETRSLMNAYRTAAAAATTSAATAAVSGSEEGDVTASPLAASRSAATTPRSAASSPANRRHLSSRLRGGIVSPPSSPWHALFKIMHVALALRQMDVEVGNRSASPTTLRQRHLGGPPSALSARRRSTMQWTDGSLAGLPREGQLAAALYSGRAEEPNIGGTSLLEGEDRKGRTSTAATAGSAVVRLPLEWLDERQIRSIEGVAAAVTEVLASPACGIECVHSLPDARDAVIEAATLVVLSPWLKSCFCFGASATTATGGAAASVEGSTTSVLSQSSLALLRRANAAVNATNLAAGVGGSHAARRRSLFAATGTAVVMIGRLRAAVSASHELGVAIPTPRQEGTANGVSSGGNGALLLPPSPTSSYAAKTTMTREAHEAAVLAAVVGKAISMARAVGAVTTFPSQSLLPASEGDDDAAAAGTFLAPWTSSQLRHGVALCLQASVVPWANRPAPFRLTYDELHTLCSRLKALAATEEAASIRMDAAVSDILEGIVACRSIGGSAFAPASASAVRVVSSSKSNIPGGGGGLLVAFHSSKPPSRCIDPSDHEEEDDDDDNERGTGTAVGLGQGVERGGASRPDGTVARTGVVGPNGKTALQSATQQQQRQGAIVPSGNETTAAGVTVRALTAFCAAAFENITLASTIVAQATQAPAVTGVDADTQVPAAVLMKPQTSPAVGRTPAAPATTPLTLVTAGGLRHLCFSTTASSPRLRDPDSPSGPGGRRGATANHTSLEGGEVAATAEEGGDNGGGDDDLAEADFLLAFHSYDPVEAQWLAARRGAAEEESANFHLGGGVASYDGGTSSAAAAFFKSAASAGSTNGPRGNGAASFRLKRSMLMRQQLLQSSADNNAPSSSSLGVGDFGAVASSSLSAVANRQQQRANSLQTGASGEGSSSPHSHVSLVPPPAAAATVSTLLRAGGGGDAAGRVEGLLTLTTSFDMASASRSQGGPMGTSGLRPSLHRSVTGLTGSLSQQYRRLSSSSAGSAWRRGCKSRIEPYDMPYESYAMTPQLVKRPEATPIFVPFDNPDRHKSRPATPARDVVSLRRNRAVALLGGTRRVASLLRGGRGATPAASSPPARNHTTTMATDHRGSSDDDDAAEHSGVTATTAAGRIPISSPSPWRPSSTQVAARYLLPSSSKPTNNDNKFASHRAAMCDGVSATAASSKGGTILLRPQLGEALSCEVDTDDAEVDEEERADIAVKGNSPTTVFRPVFSSLCRVAPNRTAPPVVEVPHRGHSSSVPSRHPMADFSHVNDTRVFCRVLQPAAPPTLAPPQHAALSQTHDARGGGGRHRGNRGDSEKERHQLTTTLPSDAFMVGLLNRNARGVSKICATLLSGLAAQS